MSVPNELQEIIDSFKFLPASQRLPLLIEFAKKLPPLPAGVEASLERVHECQTPLFLRADVDEDGNAVLLFHAPEESPTTRGFASVVAAGLNGQPVEAVLAVPEDFYADMGLAELISPLRLRGMGAIVNRVKRQLIKGR